MTRNFIKFWVLFSVTFLFCVTALAHKDRIIQLQDGILIGLPDSYEPAELDLKKFQLRIKDHMMTFSPFIQSLFPEEGRYDLQILSSWYHDLSLLPPYIILHIAPFKKDYGYEILLNLETLEVIQISVTIEESETVTRGLPISLSDSQREDIKNSISIIK